MSQAEFIEWVKYTGVIIGGIVAVAGVLSKFFSYINDLKTSIEKPFTEINGKLDHITSQQGVQNRAILTLQRRSILDACENYIKRGYATVNEKDALMRQYESYKELGGNSFVTEMVAQVKNLPLE